MTNIAAYRLRYELSAALAIVGYDSVFQYLEGAALPTCREAAIPHVEAAQVLARSLHRIGGHSETTVNVILEHLQRALGFLNPAAVNGGFANHGRQRIFDQLKAAHEVCGALIELSYREEAA